MCMFCPCEWYWFVLAGGVCCCACFSMCYNAQPPEPQTIRLVVVGGPSYQAMR